MYYNPSHLPPDVHRRLVPRHLDLLGAALERLCGQTRAEFARTLAELAASFVCQAVSAALADLRHRPAHPPWNRRDPFLNVFNDPAMEYDDELIYGWEEDYSSPLHSSSNHPTPAADKETVPAALALGLRVGGWWLSRSPGRLSLLSAATLGAATTVAAVAGGPLTLAGIGLIEAILSIASAERASRLAARLLVSSGN